MGQKTSPIGFRLVLKKQWRSIWFANKQEYGGLLAEDRAIRKFLMKSPACVGSARLVIKRMSGKIEVTPPPARLALCAPSVRRVKKGGAVCSEASTKT